MALVGRPSGFGRGLYLASKLPSTIWLPLGFARALCLARIYDVDFVLPPISDQAQISQELDDKMVGVQLAEESIQQELETIEAMPAALLRKAFSGEL